MFFGLECRDEIVLMWLYCCRIWTLVVVPTLGHLTKGKESPIFLFKKRDSNYQSNWLIKIPKSHKCGYLQIAIIKKKHLLTFFNRSFSQTCSQPFCVLRNGPPAIRSLHNPIQIKTDHSHRGPHMKVPPTACAELSWREIWSQLHLHHSPCDVSDFFSTRRGFFYFTYVT